MLKFLKTIIIKTIFALILLSGCGMFNSNEKKSFFSSNSHTTFLASAAIVSFGGDNSWYSSYNYNIYSHFMLY